MQEGSGAWYGHISGNAVFVQRGRLSTLFPRSTTEKLLTGFPPQHLGKEGQRKKLGNVYEGITDKFYPCLHILFADLPTSFWNWGRVGVDKEGSRNIRWKWQTIPGQKAYFLKVWDMDSAQTQGNLIGAANHRWDWEPWAGHQSMLQEVTGIRGILPKTTYWVWQHMWETTDKPV